jgi:endonuclease/exonuclease/phosphatase family metal-dependent hydrolase
MKTPYFLKLVPLMLFSILTSCDPFKTRLSENDVHYFESNNILTPKSTDSVKVMTWNIKFGGGRIDFFFDCFGNRVLMNHNEVIKNLNNVADFIKNTNPDILFIQEIDLNSKRSANINQIDWIINNTEFNYAVYTSQWKASYIPSKGLGRMDSGVAIFSKWPLTNATRMALPLIKEQNAVVQYFYLKRCLLECEVVINNSLVTLLTTHTEAYANDGTKKAQLELIYSRLNKLDSVGKNFIIGGDFNALPPNTSHVKGFDDSACPSGTFDADDYSHEQDWMLPYYLSFKAAVPLKNYAHNNSKYFTHTVDGNGFWNRKLDYIFSNIPFVENSNTTYQSVDNGGFDTMPISDHCAISAIWDSGLLKF